MFEKFERKLRKCMEKWTEKKRVTCKKCACTLMFAMPSSILFLLAGNHIPQIRELTSRISVFGIALWVVIVFVLCILSFKVIVITDSVSIQLKQKEKEKSLFSKLQEVLSHEEYREVIYSPDLRRYKWNSHVPYEDEELKQCEEVLCSDGVTYYAILTGSCVHIIFKNKDGERIGTGRTIDALTFCKNYKVF